jgi:hypothetical protein
MTDDQSFDAPDPFDDELRRRFAGSAPAGSDPDTVLDAMRPQLARARTRRRASFASAIAGVAVIVLALAFVLGGGSGGGGSVHTPPATQGPVRTVPPTPTTAGVGGSATTPDTLPDDHGNDQPTGVTTPSVPDATPPTEPEVAPATTTPSASSIEQASYTSDGGSITVELVNGQVSLTGSSPAPGFTDEVHDNGPTRVEVRFNNGQVEWRIRVDVVNGALGQPEITKH